MTHECVTYNCKANPRVACHRAGLLHHRWLSSVGVTTVHSFKRKLVKRSKAIDNEIYGCRLMVTTSASTCMCPANAASIPLQ